MITRTFLDKSTTIKKKNADNFGLNPICCLEYGINVSRALIHFDIDKIKSLVEDKTYIDTEKLHHVLKFKNCGRVDKNSDTLPSSDINGVKNRASSFDIVVFKVNKHWDQGKGFDNTNDFWETGKGCVSQYGSSWFNATTEELWDAEGIYSLDYLKNEYDLYLSGSNNTIIVGKQHFDYGNENFEIDITNYVNDLINGDEENYGLCIAFEPYLEDRTEKQTQYVGFFNNKTNTIFEPVLETRYDCVIKDDRLDFYLGKTNKLYLYSYIGSELDNLDELPCCFIEDDEYIVTQETKGVYSVEVLFNSNEYIKNSIVYDEWTHLKYQGNDIEDVELEFVVKPQTLHFNMTNEVVVPKILNPFVVGINDNENVNSNEKRVIKVFFKEPYKKDNYYLVDKCEYRIYSMCGESEVTIVDWDTISKMNTSNLFTINMSEFVPAEYHVDIKAQFGNEVRVFKNEITFKVVNDLEKIKL